jgi:hypothetical protein
MQCPRGLTDVARSIDMSRHAGERQAAWASVNRIPQGVVGRNALVSVPALIMLVDRAPLGQSPRHTGGAA